jgi:hypothetical protein
MDKAYAPRFELDPFGAVVQDLQGQSTEKMLGGMQEVVARSQYQGCGLTQRNLTAMLHLFDMDFRAETERQLGFGSIQYLERNPNLVAAEEACLIFNKCYYPDGDFKGDYMTDCKEKMLWWYRDGYRRKALAQGVRLVQLGEDAYWNAALEDSPYDLLYDLSAISKIMFEDVQEPPQLFFFQLPSFLGVSSNNNLPATPGRNPPTPGRNPGSTSSSGDGSDGNSNS